MTAGSFRSLLVPLDGSPFAEEALPLADVIARRGGAILELALVHHPAPPLATALEVPEIGAQLDQEARAREQRYLHGQVERLKAGGLHPVTSVVLDGGVAQSLVDHAGASGADLLVLTTHGRGPLSRFWLGSVADQLMRGLHLPLLFVRPGEAPALPPRIRRILVTLDGSPFAEQALEPARSMAAIFDAELVLLLVLEPPFPLGDPSGLTVLPATVDAERRLREQAETYLDGVASRLRNAGNLVSAATVGGTTVAGTIHEEMGRRGIDLLVLASHGAGGIERLMLGSVADKLVRGTRKPVLVIRPAPVVHPTG